MFENFFETELYNETDLCRIMNQSGSDKGNGHHNYTKFYHFIFKNMRNDFKNVFELGLGTNNPNILSNMSGAGVPCGSLRGWRSYFPTAHVYGADIDNSILSQEDRINTFFCDQTSKESIKRLCSNFDFKFDLVIEDGLHTFEANKMFFENFIEMVKPGGFFIIEDIDKKSFKEFEEFIELNKRNYKTMMLVKIPNHKNESDNNILLVER